MGRGVKTMARCEPAAWRMRFEPLAAGEAAFELPCDADGRVEIDTLDEAGRRAYFFARALRRQRFAMRIVPLIRE